VSHLARVNEAARIMREDLLSIGGSDDSAVSEDSLGSDVQGLLFVVDNLLEFWDDVSDSQKSEGGDESSSLVLRSVLDVWPPQLDGVQRKDLPLDVGWAAVVLWSQVMWSLSFNWVLGSGDSSVDAGLVREGGKGEESDVLGLLRVLGGGESPLNDSLEHVDESSGWSSGIHGDGGQVVVSLFEVNGLQLDEVSANGESW